MPTPLLSTKLCIPQARPNLVPRPRLLKKLSEGLARRLTLVSAPPGFGKTTLVVDCLQGSDRPFAWFSLDEGDNDPARFFAYLVAALQKIDPILGQDVQFFLGTPQLPPVETLVTTLINDIARTRTNVILALDDYHLIHSEAVHTSLDFFIEHQPPNLHLVLMTREDPPVSLPKLRARGELIKTTRNQCGMKSRWPAASPRNGQSGSEI